MIRLLIADDSPVFRHFLKKCMADMDDVEIVGEARDGEDTLAKITTLNPDVVTLDMSMPHMNGMQALHAMRKECPAVKAIVLTSGDESEADLTVAALDAGAFDFILKPHASVRDAKADLIASLYPRLQAVGKMIRQSATRRQNLSAIKRQPEVNKAVRIGVPDVIAIGASTGGPQALHAVLSALPDSLKVPIVLTQHMPKLFLQSLSERLERETALTCTLADEGTILQGGHIYIAPGDVHLELSRQGMNLLCHLVDSPAVHYCRPAVDPMFFSLAALAPRIRTLAVVLTGMGEDGAAGAKAISDAKGYVISQDQASSVVWGMPGATLACGAAHAVLPLDDIAAAVMAMCSRASRNTENCKYGGEYARSAV
ncbi:MAG: chemotaxis-specific protein-glutamate methyltransferase CheB [Mariprofundaceae bacterium]|nr:chemotaxis-specific protein-glutamate methyltransferase CheB [Mariprofundaceae bacterium]